MEPILTEALAVTTLFTTKKLEKGGEKLGEAVIECGGKVLASLRNKSPETVTAIEVYPAELEYAKTVEIIKNEADRDPQFAKLLQELVAAAQTDPNPKLSNIISHQPTVYNAQKLADYIKNFFQGNTIINPTFLLESLAENQVKSPLIAKKIIITSAIGIIVLSMLSGSFFVQFHTPRSEVQAIGAFKLEDIDYIYYSNGQGQYCVFDNMKNFIRLNGNDKYAKLPGKLSDYWVGTPKGYCNDEVIKTLKPKT